MENTEQSTFKKNSKKKAILNGLGVIVILTGVAYAFYALHQEQERSANRNANEVAELRNDIKGLSDKINQNANKNKTDDASTTSELLIAGEVSAFHLDTEFVRSRGSDVTYGKDSRGYDTLYVDVSVKNEGSTNAFISPALFKLKDKSGKTYALTAKAMQQRAELEGKQELQSQQLASGEKVAGTIGFQVPPDLREATLYLGGQSSPISIR